MDSQTEQLDPGITRPAFGTADPYCGENGHLGGGSLHGQGTMHPGIFLMFGSKEQGDLEDEFKIAMELKSFYGT